MTSLNDSITISADEKVCCVCSVGADSEELFPIMVFGEEVLACQECSASIPEDFPEITISADEVTVK